MTPHSQISRLKAFNDAGDGRVGRSVVVSGRLLPLDGQNTLGLDGVQ